jgi:Peptidogalycan biosysnthesis/recognition
MSEALSVAFVASEADLPADLWAQCFPPPLEGRWWYRMLEASALERQFTFLYARLDRGARPIGIAPLFLCDVPVAFLVPDWLLPVLSLPGRLLPALSSPRILFVGSPCADEGTVGLLPGVDRRMALLHLQRALEREAAARSAAMITWKDFPSGYDPDLTWLAAETGLFRAPSFPGAIVDFSSARKEDYLASLGSARRYKLRKKLERSARALDAEVEVIQRPEPPTLDEIYALFRQTRDKATTSFERLDRAFFTAAAEQPVSHFLILRERASRHMVAFMLCFHVGERVINKYIGLDYSGSRERFLYFRLFDAALDWTLARGATSLQSGQTSYAAKIEQGHRLVPLTNWACHRNPMWHRIGAYVAGRIQWQTLDDDLATYVKPGRAPGAGRAP